MNIREAKTSDYDQVWEIFSKVIATEDTYVFRANTPKEDLAKHWFANYMQTFVVCEGDRILGTYILKPSQIDLGNHIANCSYMVHPNARGKGIGQLMCKHSIQKAKESGFVAIQFNIVVSTNKNALRLWEKFGFKIIGTTPNGFRQALNGMVDTFIMYKEL